jgi:predicted nucleic acid-binding protein
MSDLGPSTRLFFDASCLIAAAASPSGGSGFLWSLCERGLLRAVVSQAVLTEAQTNLTDKFPVEALMRHYRQRHAAAPLVAAIPRLDVTPRRYPGINVKDEHVVAAAIAGDSQFILTLDRPLEREINRAQLDVQAVSPGEFINAWLPRHTSFATLREEAN